MQNPTDIIIVDDERDLIDIYVEYFSDAGFRAAGTTKPLEALHLLETNPSRLLILDHLMPGLSGLQLLEAARQSRLDLPAIVLASAYDCQFDRASQSGVSVVLRKPFKMEPFLSIIRSTLGNQSPSAVRKSIRVPARERPLLDICMGGCSMIDEQTSPTDKNEKTIELRLRTGSVLRLESEKVWVAPGRVGFRFKEMTSASSSLLLQYISGLAQELV